jgi:hypothetical protein
VQAKLCKTSVFLAKITKTGPYLSRVEWAQAIPR